MTMEQTKPMSEQEANTQVSKLCELLGDLRSRGLDDLLDASLVDRLRQALRLAREPQWVSVDYEPPKEGERVLGWSEDYERAEIVHFKGGRYLMPSEDGSKLESFEFTDTVTHWQHLPQPPTA